MPDATKSHMRALHDEKDLSIEAEVEKILERDLELERNLFRDE